MLGSDARSRLRLVRLRYAWLRGKRAGQLPARADVELGEYLSEVVGDSGGSDEELRGDLRI